jgi:hypothetical protein
MSDGPLDLSPLDPRGDEHHLEHAVSRILREAAPELARRRAPAGVMAWLERFTPAGLAAAAAVVAVSLAALFLAPRPAATSEGIGESLGIPRPLVTWADSTGVPGPGDLLLDLEELQ